MGFFEPPPPPPEPPPGPPAPEWLGPPDNVIPGTFALELVLARTDEVALLAQSGRAFPNGWEFNFGFRLRKARGHQQDPMSAWHRGRGFDEGALRFGIALADGRKATVFDRHPFSSTEGEPPKAVLRPGGGGGGGTSWDFRFWAWPLPPEGPLAFVAEWPAEHIELTRVEIDSEPIRAAAARSQELWPREGPPGGAWSSSVTQMRRNA